MKPESRKLARHLRPASDDAARARVWRGVAAAASGSSRRRVVRQTLLVASLAAAAVLAWQLRSPDEEKALTARRGGELAERWATSTESLVQELSDGSRVELQPNSSLELVTNDGEVFSTALRRGRARFVVRPGGPRRWRVEAGPAVVEVVGTVFVVERRADATDVTVERGRVVVRGPDLPDGVVSLGPGDEVRVRAPSDTSRAGSPRDPVEPLAVEDARALAESAEALAPTMPETAPPPAGAADPEPPASEPADERARASESRRAPRAPSARSLDLRLREADEARRAGRFEDARRLLVEVVHEAPQDPRAAIAEFTLARLELDQFQAPTRAAWRFREVADHPRAGALASEALALAVIAFQRGGDEASAAEVRREYLRRFPEGRHAERWRSEP